MTAEIRTVIDQLNIVGGIWHGDAPNQVAVREPKAADMPGVGKGDLFVLTEVQGAMSNRNALEQQLAQTICDAYYLSRGSITASLRRALQAAGNQLYRRNYKAGVEERVVAGVVALAMSGDDAFLAQIGPAAFFAVLGQSIQRYPDKSVWLEDDLGPEADEIEPVLGTGVVVEPTLHHLRVNPKDMLILADSRLAGHLSLDKVLKAVISGNAKATIKNMGKVAQVDDCSALALAVIEAERSAFGALTRHTPTQLSRFFDRQHNQPGAAHSAALSATEPDLVAGPVTEPGVESAMATSHSSSSFGGKKIWQRLPDWFGFFSKTSKTNGNGKVNGKQHPYEPGHPQHTITETPPTSEVDSDLEQPLKQEAKVLASIAHKPTFSPELYPHKSPGSVMTMGNIFSRLGSGLLVLVALLGSGIKTILTSILPAAGSHHHHQAGGHTQAYREQAYAIPWKLVRNIAIVVPLLIAVIVSISYIQKGRLREAEYAEFIQSARSKFQQAQAVTTDPAAALGLIAEAEALLVEAEKIKEDQPEIAEQRAQMAETADQIGKVQRLYYLPQLRQYTDSGTYLKRIIVQGVELYVLDAGTDRVFHHRLDDLGETLLPDQELPLLVSRDQQVDDVVIADLLDIVWMPAGGNRQTSDLVILNSTGLLEYNANWGTTTSPLAGGESFVLPVAVSSYFGNFYVLDPQANRLLRYLPAADGYNTPPEDYFPSDQPVTLTNAVDFTIDGAIYILFGDGRISKFEGGRPAVFNVTGLDRPFSNPVSIFTTPDEMTQYVYIADAGNQRIVQLEKDGRFVRQFKPRQGEAVSFANLQDIFVDEIGGRLYILDSNSLYMANIPGEVVEYE